MRPDEIAQMFSQIAHRYDRANHILSFNRDRAWRKILVQHAAPKAWGTASRSLYGHR
jgi:ubiquinone/menaquinone biosynthesis C-methylase UbiE